MGDGVVVIDGLATPDSKPADPFLTIPAFCAICGNCPLRAVPICRTFATPATGRSGGCGPNTAHEAPPDTAGFQLREVRKGLIDEIAELSRRLAIKLNRLTYLPGDGAV
jgi:hypothetical protein